MKVLIVGRSGEGKNYLASLLEKKGLKEVKSYTTRPKRTPDEDTHIFITPEEVAGFTDRVAETWINGYNYFTTRGQVEACDIYIIDPIGAKELLTNMPDTTFLIAHVVAPDKELVRERAIARESDKAHAGEIFDARRAAEDEQFGLFESVDPYDPGHSFLKNGTYSFIKVRNDFQAGTMEQYVDQIMGCLREEANLVEIVRQCADAGILSKVGEGKVTVYFRREKDGDVEFKDVTYPVFAHMAISDDEGLATLMRQYLALPQPEEFLGRFVDIAEDWLEEKGVKPEDIPNKERQEGDPAIIVGTDYDYFANRYAAILGMERGSVQTQSNDEILQAASITEDMAQAERCELWSVLIDVIEDWLEEKGFTTGDFPNEEREANDGTAIIYGDDYDVLAERFAGLIGISRDAEERYSPCSTNRDYGPSNPWDAPGMCIRDFI